jgi:hypothetical protein
LKQWSVSVSDEDRKQIQRDGDKMKNFNLVLKFALVNFGVIVVTGCGNSAPSSPAIPGIGIPPLAITAATLPQRCQAKGGTIIKVQGRDVCRSVTYLNYSGSFSYSQITFPKLNPSQPASYVAIPTGISVTKFDQVFFSGSSNWGSTDVNTSSWLGGFFNFTSISTNCDAVSGTGIPKSSTGAAQMNEGLPAGLVISDRTQVYALGNGGTPVTVQNAGMLTLGFNAPNSTSGLLYPYCGKITVSSLYVQHCEDGVGVPSSCQ